MNDPTQYIASQSDEITNRILLSDEIINEILKAPDTRMQKSKKIMIKKKPTYKLTSSFLYLRHSTFYILINAINLIWDGKKTKKII
jgi:hypothetical protein